MTCDSIDSYHQTVHATSPFAGAPAFGFSRQSSASRAYPGMMQFDALASAANSCAQPSHAALASPFGSGAFFHAANGSDVSAVAAHRHLPPRRSHTFSGGAHSLSKGSLRYEAMMGGRLGQAYAAGDATIRVPRGGAWPPPAQHVQFFDQHRAAAADLHVTTAHWQRQHHELQQQGHQLRAALAAAAAPPRPQQQQQLQLQQYNSLPHPACQPCRTSSGNSSDDSCCSTSELAGRIASSNSSNSPPAKRAGRARVVWFDETGGAADSPTAAAQQASALQAIELELQELQRLRAWLANASATAAPGTSAAAACAAAATRHQSVLEQALAAKAVIQSAAAAQAAPSCYTGAR